MQSNFDLFFQRVLKDEGTGYEDVPGDNGGPTKCGITIADVARWNGVKLSYDRQGHLIRSGKAYVAMLEKTKQVDPRLAHDIYKKFYWDAVRADELPAGLDYAVVDFAVNSGTGKAVPTLGELCGVSCVAVTDALLAAVRAYPTGLADLIADFQDERQQYLEQISRQAKNRKFKKGWLAREARVRKQSLDLAAAAVTPATPAAVAASPKAVAEAGIVTVADLTPVSRKAKALTRAKFAAHSIWASLTVGSFLEWLGFAKSTMDQVQQFVSQHAIVLFITGSILAVLVIKYVLSLMVEDVAQGRATPSGAGAPA